MPPTRVIGIRHGETAWNAIGRWQGHAPVPLNAAGLEQAAMLGRYVAQHGLRFDVLYSSDLKRALQTAQAVAEPQGLTVRPDARLREVDLGEWQGLTRDEVKAWDGERYAAYLNDWYHVPPPSGESRHALKLRIRAAFDDLAQRHAGQVIGMVTHGGTLGMLIESLFGPVERPSLANTSLTIVERAAPDEAWQLVRVAWSPHLDEAPLGETW